MAIGKAEVLAILRDRVLWDIRFSVGAITVGIEGYRDVYDYIEAGDITVTPGTSRKTAFYDGTNNTIETQATNRLLGIADRAQIVHECTHAIVDINRLDVLRLNDEVAAYIAQLTYMVISHPTPFPSGGSTQGASPLGRLVFAVLKVIEKYSLHTQKGFGARISELDIWRLQRDVQRMPDYAAVTRTEKSAGRGVALKNNDMRSLREALKRARRSPTEYSPSPRLMIF